MSTKFLKAEEVASILDVSKSFVYKLIREGSLPAVRFGSAVRVLPEELSGYVESCKVIDINTFSLPDIKPRRVP